MKKRMQFLSAMLTVTALSALTPQQAWAEPEQPQTRDLTFHAIYVPAQGDPVKVENGVCNADYFKQPQGGLKLGGDDSSSIPLTDKGVAQGVPTDWTCGYFAGLAPSIGYLFSGWYEDKELSTRCSTTDIDYVPFSDSTGYYAKLIPMPVLELEKGIDLSCTQDTSVCFVFTPQTSGTYKFSTGASNAYLHVYDADDKEIDYKVSGTERPYVASCLVAGKKYKVWLATDGAAQCKLVASLYEQPTFELDKEVTLTLENYLSEFYAFTPSQSGTYELHAEGGYIALFEVDNEDEREIYFDKDRPTYRVNLTKDKRTTFVLFCRYGDESTTSFTLKKCEKDVVFEGFVDIKSQFERSDGVLLYRPHYLDYAYVAPKFSTDRSSYITRPIGEQVVLHAPLSMEGLSFKGWFNNQTREYISQERDYLYTITDPHVLLYAVYCVEEGYGCVEVSARSEGGYAALESGDLFAVVAFGDTVTLKAVPKADCEFAKWTSAGSYEPISDQATYQYKVVEDLNQLWAWFDQKEPEQGVEYADVYISCNRERCLADLTIDGEKVFQNVSSIWWTVRKGSSVTIEPKPVGDAEFVGWCEWDDEQDRYVPTTTYKTSTIKIESLDDAIDVSPTFASPTKSIVYLGYYGHNSGADYYFTDQDGNRYAGSYDYELANGTQLTFHAKGATQADRVDCWKEFSYVTHAYTTLQSSTPSAEALTLSYTVERDADIFACIDHTLPTTNGMATYCDGCDAYTVEGGTAYWAEYEEAVGTEGDEDYQPARVHLTPYVGATCEYDGVLIRSDRADGTVTLKYTEWVDEKEDNILRGNDDDENESVSTYFDEEETIYGLWNKTTPVEFRKYTGDIIPAHKALLGLTSVGEPAARLDVVFDGETGLHTLTADQKFQQQVFDMMGRTVSEGRKGLQIRGGRVVFER